MTSHRLATLTLTLLATSLAATACDSATDLDEVPDLTVSVMLRPDQAGQPSLYVWLGGCFAVGESFRATLNDLPARRLYHGGDDDDFWCAPPSAEFRLDPAAPLAAAEVVIGDDSRTIRIDLGDRLAATRSTQLLAPADGVVRPGQAVELRWSSPTDPGLAAATVSFRFGTDAVLNATSSTIGDRVSATAPATLPTAGSGRVCATLDRSSQWDALPCTGASCRTSTKREACAPIAYFAP